MFSLRPEHIRLKGRGEVQVQGVVQAVQYQGAATRFELKLADGETAGQPGEPDGRNAAATLSPGSR
jgi:putative spermidine/putrescine transport system ATP-binding protein